MSLLGIWRHHLGIWVVLSGDGQNIDLGYGRRMFRAIVGRVGLYCCDFFHVVHSGDDAAEGGVLMIELLGVGVIEADEELAAGAVGIGSAGH